MQRSVEAKVSGKLLGEMYKLPVVKVASELPLFLVGRPHIHMMGVSWQIVTSRWHPGSQEAQESFQAKLSFHIHYCA